MFCPQNWFMCFTWISQKTVLISRYSINRLALVTEKGCVYCAVRAEQFRLTAVFKSRETAQAVSCRSLIAGSSDSIPGQSMWHWWWTKWDGLGFSRSTSVFPVNRHSTNAAHLHLRVAPLRNTNGRSLGALDRKCFHFVFEELVSTQKKLIYQTVLQFGIVRVLFFSRSIAFIKKMVIPGQ